MPVKIVKAAERIQNLGIKMLLDGAAKIGKTSQLRTLHPEKTLFVDLEAGGLAISDLKLDSIEVRDWCAARDLGAWIGGPDPSRRPDQPFSEEHYKFCCEQLGDPSALNKYETVFIDSLSVAGRLAFQWCLGQPQAFSERTGKPDNRGAYGLLGKELIQWVTHLQHTPGKNIIFVCLLDAKRDDFNRPFFELQIEGSKTALELPGIVDEIVTLAEIRPDDGKPYRAFVCTSPNDWGFPAGDRSGKLDMLEPPHLGRLLDKIKNGPRRDPSTFSYSI